MKLFIPDYILSIKPYVPGKPIEELEREYGIGHSIKLASNENPLGPSPKALKAIEGALKRLNRYPDGGGYDLVRKISEKLNLSPENVVLGNGSDDIIGMLARAILTPGVEAVLPRSSFLMYEIVVRTAGAKPVFVPLQSLAIDLDGILGAVTPLTRMVFINNPNNPTGTVVARSDFKRFLENLAPGIVVVLDEAYIEFVRDEDCAAGLEFFSEQTPLVVLRTFSKAYGLAGLRIGYGVMPAKISRILNRIRQPFNTSLAAQAGALAALDDDEFLVKTIRLIHDGLDYLYDRLEKINVKYFPTQANYLLIDVERDADDVFEKMLRQGVIVRSMAAYGFPEYIRVNVGLPEENERFIQALDNVMGSRSPGV
ncbi:MAG: histidinol-phosphate transaminase [Desulfobacterales bacterium]|nr:histidinol-phosphate transaminase [Desulfobacterales bacterium]